MSQSVSKLDFFDWGPEPIDEARRTLARVALLENQSFPDFIISSGDCDLLSQVFDYVSCYTLPLLNQTLREDPIPLPEVV